MARNANALIAVVLITILAGCGGSTDSSAETEPLLPAPENPQVISTGALERAYPSGPSRSVCRQQTNSKPTGYNLQVLDPFFDSGRTSPPTATEDPDTVGFKIDFSDASGRQKFLGRTFTSTSKDSLTMTVTLYPGVGADGTQRLPFIAVSNPEGKGDKGSFSVSVAADGLSGTVKGELPTTNYPSTESIHVEATWSCNQLLSATPS